LEIVLQRINKLELVKRVIELEKEGWEPSCQIKQVSDFRLEFTYKEKGITQNDKRSYNRFSEASQYTVWKIKMRKDF
jgi:hypothetical protein